MLHRQSEEITFVICPYDLFWNNMIKQLLNYLDYSFWMSNVDRKLNLGVFNSFNIAQMIINSIYQQTMISLYSKLNVNS